MVSFVLELAIDCLVGEFLFSWLNLKQSVHPLAWKAVDEVAYPIVCLLSFSILEVILEVPRESSL